MNGCSCKSHIQLLIKNSLAAISLSAVRKNRDNAFARAKSFRNFVRRGGSGARRPAAEQSFQFRNLLQRRANFVVLDHHDLVGESRVKDLWNKIALADAFDFLWSRWSAAVNRSFRFYKNTKHVGIVFSNRTRDAAKRARSSRANHDGVDVAVHLFDDLARCREFMKTRVRIILKLLRHETAVDRVRELVTTVDRALNSRLVGDVFDLTAEGFDQLHLLDCVASRDAENNTVAARNSHECEADAGVAGGRLDYRGAGFEESFFLGIENHPQRRSVFNRSTGIKPFDFCVDTAEWWLCETGKMKKGSLAYKIQNTFCDTAVHRSGW